ncbi:HAD-IIA family hydrolase [Tropicimonas sp. IMCC34043]|uniref:HAD-IIA family hydrolase n=1 Tax=Tropicimonas sp. IMCC34043 TaxID=2248760 RepID=UPI001E2D351A|nr:HAD hydrolase-like protein [Tropicimonas sp. IMCC34043]
MKDADMTRTGSDSGLGHAAAIPQTTGAAFAAYEAVRHRLPPAGRPGACIAAETLDDIAGHFDAFLLDAFGVLNIGETAIPGVADRIAGLRARGKRVMVVSNAAGLPQATLVAKYARLGYDFAPEDVISSRAALLAGMAGWPRLSWGIMANPEVGLADLEALDVTYLQDDPAAYAAVEGFLLVGSGVWTARRQQMLEAALIARPRPVLVGNPDIVAPCEAGFSIEPGFYAHRVAEILGVVPEFFGKPYGNIYDLAFRRLGPDVPPERIVMVGDSLHTDILGAQTAGIGSALIAGYGFFAGHDAQAAIAGSGIRPDYVLARP